MLSRPKTASVGRGGLRTSCAIGASDMPNKLISAAWFTATANDTAFNAVAAEAAENGELQMNGDANP